LNIKNRIKDDTKITATFLTHELFENKILFVIVTAIYIGIILFFIEKLFSLSATISAIVIITIFLAKYWHHAKVHYS